MTLHVITMDGYTAKINYAEECVNPREWANSTMFCGHRRYALGDVQLTGDYPTAKIEVLHWIYKKHKKAVMTFAQTYSPAKRASLKKFLNGNAKSCEILDDFVDAYFVMLPLHLYQHSGIKIYVGSCRTDHWDTGFLGYVLQKLKKGDCRDEITQEIHHEVKRYSEYVDGEQFEYRIYDNDNNFVTSSIGYEDQEAACDNAKEELEDLVACMKTSSHVTFSQPGLPLV